MGTFENPDSIAKAEVADSEPTGIQTTRNDNSDTSLSSYGHTSFETCEKPEYSSYDSISFLDHESSQFFNDAYFNEPNEIEGYYILPEHPSIDNENSHAINDSVIDPFLHDIPGGVAQDPGPLARYFSPPPPVDAEVPPHVAYNHDSPESASRSVHQYPPPSNGLLFGAFQPSSSKDLHSPRQTSNIVCKFSRKPTRRTKRDESTFDHTYQANLIAIDKRLPSAVELTEKKSFSCPLPTVEQNPSRFLPSDPRLVAAPGLRTIKPEYRSPLNNMDEFLASVDPSLLNPNIEEQFIVNEMPDSQSPTRVMNRNDFTLHMLAPYATPVQPVEKRKRGRPKKDETEELQESHPRMYQIQAMIPLHSGLRRAQTPRQHTSVQNQVFAPPPASPCSVSQLPKTPDYPYEVFERSYTEFSDDFESSKPSKRRKRTINGGYRSMSKKEQAYIEMDKNVKLYDEMNIGELLSAPKLRPGRTPCFWIQRHPYANTKVYTDHYKTWCRYRHCKGVETHEMIRTSSGEWKEKNYKHPRTIIAGNYQVAVDWEHVVDEISTFKDDSDGQYEYDKRNVFDTVECFFHLRCFEKVLNFPALIREQLVKSDHRVLNKDKSRNKITKRKNKGGTNATEIEWYLKAEAEAWIERVKIDRDFNPGPGSDDSLEKVLLNGKKRYNDRKGMGKYASRTTSPALSNAELSTFWQEL